MATTDRRVRQATRDRDQAAADVEDMRRGTYELHGDMPRHKACVQRMLSAEEIQRIKAELSLDLRTLFAWQVLAARIRGGGPTRGLTLDEIKSAVMAGKRVCWSSGIYEVRYHDRGGWNIVCTVNGSCIGLTHLDGVTMNGSPAEFYIAQE